jgi:carbon-monoxide dehydrogenase large subunit
MSATGRRGDRRDAGAGAQRRRGDRGRLRRQSCRRWSRTRRGHPKGAPQVHRRHAPTTCYDWELRRRKGAGGRRLQGRPRTSPGSSLVNNRLIPNAMEPRAAVADYDTGIAIHYTLYTTSQNPHIVTAAHERLRLGHRPEHKLRVIAPDVGGGFGSKISIYAEEAASPGRRRRSAGRSSGRPSAANPSCPTRMAATTSPMPSSRWTRTAGSSASRSDTIANMGAYLSTFSSAIPTYLYGDSARRPVHDAGDPLRE